jgi:hypothetical protein
MRAGYDLHSLLDQSAQVEAVYLNKRLDNSTSAKIAVQTNDLQAHDQRQVIHHWLSKPTVSEDEPPNHLPNHYISVFRDVIVLEGVVDVWEDMDQHGHRVCKGIRAPEQILGLWKVATKGVEQSQIFPQQNLQGWYLVNVQYGNRWEVCIVREGEAMLDGEQFLLWEGCEIVWWTGANGNIVRVS